MEKSFENYLFWKFRIGKYFKIFFLEIGVWIRVCSRYNQYLIHILLQSVSVANTLHLTRIYETITAWLDISISTPITHTFSHHNALRIDIWIYKLYCSTIHPSAAELWQFNKGLWFPVSVKFITKSGCGTFKNPLKTYHKKVAPLPTRI